MSALMSRDVVYEHDGARMIGRLCAPEGAEHLPGILLVHDAFGLTEDFLRTAERYAGLGYAVLAADVWGERARPRDESEVGPFIGGMVRDRPRWIARIAAAHEAAAAQPEVDPEALVAIGYCFGGSSALEHLRTGGALRGVVSVHGGLDLLAPDWGAADPGSSVLVLTGADDPMATAEQRALLESELDGAGIEWQVHLYSDTRHAFTNPKSARTRMPETVAYNPRSAARAWTATAAFLAEVLPAGA